MISSPFQQPSRRQNALALQIQEARTIGDEALLSRLISQWVHRYGFNGAAALDLSLPELAASNREFSPIGVVEEPFSAPDSLAEDEVVMQDEVAAEEEMVREEEGIAETVAEDAPAVEDAPFVAEEEEAVMQDEVVAETTELQRSLKVAPVPAPPISTPRSLRRWLPRREDDAFPKAS